MAPNNSNYSAEAILKLESLFKILIKEQDDNYQDKTVVGGLDLFLQRWSAELGSVIGEFSSYSILTHEGRISWVSDRFGNIENFLERCSSDKVGSRVKRSKDSSNRKNRTALKLDDDISSLERVTKTNLRHLGRLGVKTVYDLIYLFPHRHNDFANTRKVSELQFGEEQTIVVTVWEASETRQGPKRRSTQAVLGDDSGNVRAIWFNQPYLVQTFKPGTQVVISGKVNVFRGNFVFESPEYELLRGQEQLLHTGRLVPVYPSVDGLPQRTIRRLVNQALEVVVPQIKEFITEDIRDRLALMDLHKSIYQIHYPDSHSEWNAARRRLAFDELFLLQITVLKRKLSWQHDEDGIPLNIDSKVLSSFLQSLPFDLTSDQTEVLDNILDDLRSSRPMSRLLQGDVGSGKTVVALASMLFAPVNGFQAVLMAPTEILAEQHFVTITHLLNSSSPVIREGAVVTVDLAGSGRPVRIGLLIGSLPKKVKDSMHREIASGDIDFVVGTHAIIQDDVEVPKLALAIVDEQHRFGVMQRTMLRSKGGRPHLLAMSATPIPRSLALTLYGDLDISVIREMPAGRLPIKTRWIEPERRITAYAFIKKQVDLGHQAFIVCPLIDESEAIQSRAATEEHTRLSSDIFPDLRLGLLHGRMPLKEKEEVMKQFKEKELDVLVSTPVVEVGIDIPNATVMLVDGADRFGLAQLHQFRGRVGRSSDQSYCLLLSDQPSKEAMQRLKVVEHVGDGFKLAEEDLRLRGPGDYIGTRQSGLPNLKIASITDHDILSLARNEASKTLEEDPRLEMSKHKMLSKRVSEHSKIIIEDIS